MHEELNQLIRLAQVLRVRSNNLAARIDGSPKPSVGQVAKAKQVADLALEAEAKLKQIHAYFD